jgi:hypothetical protein
MDSLVMLFKVQMPSPFSAPFLGVFTPYLSLFYYLFRLFSLHLWAVSTLSVIDGVPIYAIVCKWEVEVAIFWDYAFRSSRLFWDMVTTEIILSSCATNSTPTYL